MTVMLAAILQDVIASTGIGSTEYGGRSIRRAPGCSLRVTEIDTSGQKQCGTPEHAPYPP
eukprot:CAMPEP_0113665904 /NCGR_PEP_ID=MMETSP0038_2-20120614/2561_1 /TAXON_ID=2898 /ORGANISM="Cryptomonas paramecium" /LENGTH=59 /DNA_ID=CAMNT_0000581303 /DNA_START=202 /DNA_END=382 /DNA_ORIENTATION=- /assembly_acc=CAM_ASM_000170